MENNEIKDALTAKRKVLYKRLMMESREKFLNNKFLEYILREFPEEAKSRLNKPIIRNFLTDIEESYILLQEYYNMNVRGIDTKDMHLITSFLLYIIKPKHLLGEEYNDFYSEEWLFDTIRIFLYGNGESKCVRTVLMDYREYRFMNRSFLEFPEKTEFSYEKPRLVENEKPPEKPISENKKKPEESKSDWGMSMDSFLDESELKNIKPMSNF